MIEYDWIGLKSNQCEIKSPPITHLVMVVEERAKNTSSPKLKTSYVRISDSLEPDTLPRDETSRPSNSGSDIEPGKHLDLPGPELATSEIIKLQIQSWVGVQVLTHPSATINTLQVIQALQTYVT